MKSYLKEFYLPTPAQEDEFVWNTFGSCKLNCFASIYPFRVLNGKVTRLDFAPITIFYGGNGSGKTTVLNLIAEKLAAKRISPFNKSPFYPNYLANCQAVSSEEPEEKIFIASDDIFLSMLNSRFENESNDAQRNKLIKKGLDGKRNLSRSGSTGSFKMQSLDDYQKLCEAIELKQLSVSRYVKKHIRADIREASNGQLAFLFFTTSIREDSLVLLDEPENSLSPTRQLELAQYLIDSARLGTQLIIATHSPLLLALPEAKVYDFDCNPIAVKPWYKLESSRIYYDFFHKHAKYFETEN
ncbi:MAG: AAA family ATPase [Lentisphaeria bacterium]|nr:AAA family ATPase [Lentisphaeria bacterium]